MEVRHAGAHIAGLTLAREELLELCLTKGTTHLLHMGMPLPKETVLAPMKRQQPWQV